MTIGRELTSLTLTERLKWINERRERRGIAHNRRPRGKTLTALATAWGIDKEAIKRAVIEIANLKPKERKMTS